MSQTQGFCVTYSGLTLIKTSKDGEKTTEECLSLLDKKSSLHLIKSMILILFVELIRSLKTVMNSSPRDSLLPYSPLPTTAVNLIMQEL